MMWGGWGEGVMSGQSISRFRQLRCQSAPGQQNGSFSRLTCPCPVVLSATDGTAAALYVETTAQPSCLCPLVYTTTNNAIILLYCSSSNSAIGLCVIERNRIRLFITNVEWNTHNSYNKKKWRQVLSHGFDRRSALEFSSTRQKICRHVFHVRITGGYALAQNSQPTFTHFHPP